MGHRLLEPAGGPAGELAHSGPAACPTDAAAASSGGDDIRAQLVAHKGSTRLLNLPSQSSPMHSHGWQLGLKTREYNLRTKAATMEVKFPFDVEKVRRASAAQAGEQPPQAAGNATSGASGVEKQAIEQLSAPILAFSGAHPL